MVEALVLRFRSRTENVVARADMLFPKAVLIVQRVDLMVARAHLSVPEARLSAGRADPSDNSRPSQDSCMNDGAEMRLGGYVKASFSRFWSRTESVVARIELMVAKVHMIRKFG
jgi:hypothetical protein